MSTAVKERVAKEKGGGERKDKRYREKLQRKTGKTQDKEKERKGRGQVGKGAKESGEKKTEILWESSLLRRQEGWRDFISSRRDQASYQQFTVVEFLRFFFVCVYVFLGN